VAIDPRPRVWFLGTSASVTSRTRRNAAFALSPGIDSRLWLIDGGPGVLDRLDECGLDPGAIEHVFVTHQHGDHLLGLPMLNNARWDSGDQQLLTIHGPSAALSAVRQVTLAVFPDHRDRLQGFLSFHPHSTAARIAQERIGAIPVRSAPATHNVAAVAYRFDMPGGAVVFSGDTGPSTLIAELARGADLLVHDATFSGLRKTETNAPDHSTPRDAGQVAAWAGVRALALVHLPPETAGFEDVIREEASAVFDGEVLIPNDGDLFEL
jgi:ribonuclease BN (tRNA processing enzyme)